MAFGQPGRDEPMQEHDDGRISQYTHTSHTKEYCKPLLDTAVAWLQLLLFRWQLLLH